ncbi:MAG: hypothetical protein GY760_13300 [Deltaproteobacteria bacterium]|nr:hypothetical protein [Deltaproteobacteria bacterium]
MTAHICDELKKQVSDSMHEGHPLINYIFEKDEGEYLLTKHYYADEQTVYDGEADSIGEIVSSYTMKINYCPFCGKKLT